jgi:RNA recognition motif-containing protein
LSKSASALDVNQWHLEEHFSQVGPIKKCSVISNQQGSGGNLGYGFVKFVLHHNAMILQD